MLMTLLTPFLKVFHHFSYYNSEDQVSNSWIFKGQITLKPQQALIHSQKLQACGPNTSCRMLLDYTATLRINVLTQEL